MAERGLPDDSRLIVTRTPLRVSFFGGGTDLPAFYEREGGAVLSAAIQRYVYVTVKRHSELFLEPIRINYSKSEEVDTIDEIANNIARECLRLLAIEPPIYISTVADVPASTGLGGSSAFAVGLLHALHAYRGEQVSAGQLAEEASHIEMEVLGEPIGKQDQYAAAYGGLNLFRFKGGGGVTVEHLRMSHQDQRELFRCLLMFWTGHQRDASQILIEVQRNAGDKLEYLRKIRDQALEVYGRLHAGPFDLRALGRELESGWQWKRELASTISNQEIDRWYETARRAGAEGGKLCGAGGGGFLLFMAPPEKHAAIREALSELQPMAVSPEPRGSQLLPAFGG